MHLHKRDVVLAATAILDSYGIGDLTMRRLARELDITPGALYWHFTSKQQLLGAVADELLHSVCIDPKLATGTDWRHRVSTVCSRLREALLSHTDGAELVSASFAAGQSRGAIEVLALLTETAVEAGLDHEHAALAARTVVNYVLGATADEQSRRQWNAAGALSAAPAPAAGFEFGLRLLIDGLAAQSMQPEPSAADQVLETLVTVPPS